MKSAFCLSVIFVFTLFTVHAQYEPSQIFQTNFYNYKGNVFRSASGKPTSKYWQNEADYTVEADFDVESGRLSGRVVIAYTNNSPDNLDNLWLQLDQNTNKSEARGNQMQRPNDSLDDDEGYRIKDVQLERQGQKHQVAYVVKGTRMQIRLADPIDPKEEITLVIHYDYLLQENGGGGRSGYMDTDDGRIYEFSYWYPRMSVYDDYYGWNTLPFIGGGELYLDYGTIDYKVSVPADQVVVGSGILKNKNDILNKRTLKRLQKASQSDKTVMIRKPNELDQPITTGEKDKVTWHFKMENTRDVAWAMSTAFVWDAARINLSEGKAALAQSVYPKASTQKGRGWARSTEMLKFSTEFFSDYLMDYPYAVATSVGGSVGGMEFPGIVFNYWDVEEDVMFLLASHEIGHTWFPMIVGSDERRNPFLDEGLNVFMDIYAQEAYNDGEFAPKRDGEYAPNGGNPADEIIDVMKEAGDRTIMSRPDDIDYKYTHPLEYFKAAFGLVLLREVILGHDSFDYAFKQYAENWAYKHPRPEDFFRSMDNGSGEDLTWFWQGWFMHNWQLDQAVKKVAYIKDDPVQGAKITVQNKRKMVMPVLVKVEETNGETHEFKVPVEIWKFGQDAEFQVNTSSKIKQITLDPDQQLPDMDRTNNTWRGK